MKSLRIPYVLAVLALVLSCALVAPAAYAKTKCEKDQQQPQTETASGEEFPEAAPSSTTDASGEEFPEMEASSGEEFPESDASGEEFPERFSLYVSLLNLLGLGTK